MPPDRLGRAQVLQWMFFEQYSHEPYVAPPRCMKKPLPEDSLIAAHLATRRYFVSARGTIADIALHAYTHVADEAGLDLAPYPHLGAWLARVAGQLGAVPLTRRPCLTSCCAACAAPGTPCAHQAHRQDQESLRAGAR
jgi:glutathione S-transferase